MTPVAANLGTRASQWSRLSLASLAVVGGFARAQCEEMRHAAAVIGTVLLTAVRPRFWSRPVRTAFARQVLDIGSEPLWFVGAVAAFVGISVVVQLTFWVGEAGQSQLVGPLLLAVGARGPAPGLLRSGSSARSRLSLAVRWWCSSLFGSAKQASRNWSARCWWPWWRANLARC